MEIPPELLAAYNQLVSALTFAPGIRGVEIALGEEDGELTDELKLRVLVNDLDDIPIGTPTDASGIPVFIGRAQPQLDADLARYPLLQGGIAYGHVTQAGTVGGTLGGIVRDLETGDAWAITNDHSVGLVGSSIYQPPKPFSEANFIGNVIRTKFAESPVTRPVGHTDAALFSMTREAAASIVNIGLVTGMTAPKLKEMVRKRGAATLLTHGTISGFGAYEQRGALLLDQFTITVDKALSQEWSNGGDSGALVVKEVTGEVVGIHWGHDEHGRGYASNILRTCEELGVTFVWPQPRVDSVSPPLCPADGGELIVIEGFGLQLATGVMFGQNHALSFDVANDTTIVAVAPPGNGLALVTVTGPGGASDPLVSPSLGYFQ